MNLSVMTETFIFLCALEMMIQKCRCSGFMWLPGTGRIFAHESESVDMVWTFGYETTLQNLKLDIILTFMGHRESFERDVVNQAVPLTPAATENLQIKDRHMSSRISCDYTYTVTHKLHCKLNNVMVADTGDYRLHLTVRDSEIRAKVVNSTCLYVNYDYTLKTYPRDIRTQPKDSVLWTFSFKNPKEIVPVFLINIKISYSNSTASENMVQWITREIPLNTTREIPIEVSDKVLPFYNRSGVVYQQGTLTIEIRELSKEDSGSFQIVFILGSKEGTHRQSYLVDNVALFMVEDHTLIVNKCNVTTCSTSPAITHHAPQIKGLTAALALCGAAFIAVASYLIYIKVNGDEKRKKTKETKTKDENTSGGTLETDQNTSGGTSKTDQNTSGGMWKTDQNTPGGTSKTDQNTSAGTSKKSQNTSGGTSKKNQNTSSKTDQNNSGGTSKTDQNTSGGTSKTNENTSAGMSKKSQNTSAGTS